jgi:hypothetical protein
MNVMELQIWKSKLVALWILQILNFIAVLIIPSSMTKIIEEVGEAIEPLIAFYFFLTALMIWLTVFAKPNVARWPVIVVGVFYSFVKVQWIVNALSGEIVIELFLTEVWGLVAALMIIWLGWNSPKSAATQT